MPEPAVAPHDQALACGKVRGVSDDLDEVTTIMRSMLGRLDELVEQVREDVWGTVDDYPDTVADKDEFELVVRRSLQAVLAATAQVQPIGPDDLEVSIQLGEARATQGVSAASLLQSYRAAERCLVGNFLAEADGLDGPSCGRGVRMLSVAIDQLERSAVQAHQRMVRAVVLDHETTVASLISRLASGVVIDPAFLIHHAAIIGVDPAQPYVGVAVLVPSAVDPARVPKLRRQVALRISELVRAKVPSVGWQGALLFVVPNNAAHGRLIEVLQGISNNHPFGDPLVVGVGSVVNDLASAGETLRQSIAAARSASNEDGRGNVVHYPDVALEVLLASNQEVMRTITEHRLGPLLGKDDLRRTLEAYLANGRQVTRAADELGIHPNTVSYRLRQIERLAGIDIHNARDLAVMDMALLALRVLRSDNVGGDRSDRPEGTV